MELYLIEKERLKIVLTHSDLREHSLSFRELDYKEEKTREFIGELMQIAEEKTGFKPSKGRLSIELFGKLSGGCDIYAANLTDEYIFSPLCDIQRVMPYLEGAGCKIDDGKISVRLDKGSLLYCILSEFGALTGKDSYDGKA